MDFVFAAVNTTVTATNGGQQTLTKGEAWAADDEIVRRFPQFFTATPPRLRTHRGYITPDDDRSTPPPVEVATAAPGETRNVTPPRSKKGGEKK